MCDEGEGWICVMREVRVGMCDEGDCRPDKGRYVRG